MTMQYENSPMGFGPRAMIVRLMRMGMLSNKEANNALHRVAAADELHKLTYGVPGLYAVVLCEDCGPIQVNANGDCISGDCFKPGHAASIEPQTPDAHGNEPEQAEAVKLQSPTGDQ